MLREFVTVYRLYRRFHPPGYALRMAWDIGVRRLPF